MIPIKGAKIISYGQEVKIDEVTLINDKYFIVLEHPIVVPTREYTRNFIDENEIQRYVE